MSLIIPNTFATKTGLIQLSDLDDNFTEVANSIATVDEDVATLGSNLSLYAIPSGGIIMWSGSILTIPVGWLLCNGLNNTPDLRNRFIIGANSDDSSIAKTNITGSQTQTGGSKDSTVVEHTHTATSVVTDSGHFHNTGYSNNASVAPRYGSTTTTSTNIEDAYGSSYRTTSPNTSTATTGVTVATTNALTGVSGTDTNLPPYFALAFIMKT